MNWLTIIVCHLLLVTIALALPANKIENKSHAATTAAPSKDTKTKLTKEQVDKNNKKLGKSTLVAKKRDLAQLFEENSDENYGGKSVEEYAKALALGPSFDNSRIENTILKAEAYGDPASINDYRYYGGEDRKKRTAIFDLYNRPGADYSKRELPELTPDQVLTLLALMQQQQRINYPLPQSRYSFDFDNSIDLPEAELEDEDVSNEYPENRFDELYDRRFLPHWGNFAKDKRFIVSKRSSYSGK